MTKALYNLQLISDGQIAAGKAVLISGDKITAVVDQQAIPDGADKIDLGGAYLAPGLIDLQIYGSGGKLFAGKPEVEALKILEDDLLNQGTIGFFATIGTNTNEIFEQGIEAAKAFRKVCKGNYLGLHFEGPYLNPIKKGAHPANLIKKGTLAEVKGWVEAAGGELKMMTIAPELQDQELIDYLHNQGVIISSGHSNATYAEGKAFHTRGYPFV
jgi:N-acetylglucosamine-6-phosphate deacetylase